MPCLAIQHLEPITLQQSVIGIYNVDSKAHYDAFLAIERAASDYPEIKISKPRSGAYYLHFSASTSEGKRQLFLLDMMVPMLWAKGMAVIDDKNGLSVVSIPRSSKQGAYH